MKIEENIEINERRNTALDIIRILALFCVVSVHFFLNIGFYEQKMVGVKMYLMTTMRSAFMICVPLFLILTGYLMNNKRISKKYYSGIIKTIIIYILASVTCIACKIIFYNYKISLKEIILEILGFSAINYAWYVEMYIGLFLIIPFLNILYNNIESKKNKKILIGTLLALTAAPSLFNIFNFNVEGQNVMGKATYSYNKIVPQYWISIYPITYYFIGSYLKEYNLKINKKINILSILLIIIANGALNYFISYGNVFVLGKHQDWASIINTIQSVLVFVLILNINFETISKSNKKVIKCISDYCFGAYLSSYIFDGLFYKILNNFVPVVSSRFKYYIIIVPVVFMCSIILSTVFNLIFKLIMAKKNKQSINFIKEDREKEVLNK